MHKILSNPIPFSLLIAVSLALLSACGGGDSDDSPEGTTAVAPAGSIQVDLVNWAINPAQQSAPAGKVTFWAVHEEAHAHESGEGGDIHDLQVMKKQVDGSYAMVGQVQGLKMGDAKALTLTLTAGEYELACTVVEMIDGKAIAHYAKGMRTPFKVV